MTRSLHHLGAVLAGLALSMVALTATAGTADAIKTPPQPPTTNPCLHLVGTPDPCAPPPPEHPEPVDPTCLRVDTEPRHCPYQP